MSFLGIPGAGEEASRRLGYQQQIESQRSQYAHQRGLASRRIGAAVGSAMGTTGNANIAGRLAARESGRVLGDLGSQEAAAHTALEAQQSAQEQAVHRQDMDTQRQIFGGLIGGAGQVLGMAVPAFGALNGAAGGGASGGGVGAIASQLVGGGRPAQPPAQPAMGAVVSPLAGAPDSQPSQMISPSGAQETFDERMRRLSLGGAFR